MTDRDDLIASLSAGLPAVKPVANTGVLAAIWLIVSALWVVGVTHFFGPLRPGALEQLGSEPRFLFESLTGVAAIAWISLLAFKAAIPGALSRRFAVIGALLMVLWWGSYLVGLVIPALEPSMLGKRAHCFVETLVYSVPPILLGLFMLRRLYPLQPVRTGMAVSLAAGMLPALYMQLACMYAPDHILLFHMLPGLAMVLAGAALARLLSWPSTSVQG